MQIYDLTDKNILITGSSRGIGAEIAIIAAKHGANVIINYRSKEKRAEKVANTLTNLGAKTVLTRADLTNTEDLDSSFKLIKKNFNKLDILILNASGGLEKGKDPDYAMQLNRDAQLEVIKRSLELMPEHGKIVFVTSHLAHFFGEKPIIPGYEAVAKSKKAGETAIRALIPTLEKRKIKVIVVSGDLIEGTITPKLFERVSPGLIDRRREQVGSLPTTYEFANAIVAAASNAELISGSTVYVGATDWDLQAALS